MLQIFRTQILAYIGSNSLTHLSHVSGSMLGTGRSQAKCDEVPALEAFLTYGENINVKK